MSDADRARTLATNAHRGQVDKAGAPYVEHPARVAGRLAEESAEAVAAAWLHDVVEDTGTTLEDLREAGFSKIVVDAVDALTKRPGESKIEYYSRVAANPIALKVKVADIADNSDPERLNQLDPATAQRLRTKYTAALRTLGTPAPAG